MKKFIHCFAASIIFLVFVEAISYSLLHLKLTQKVGKAEFVIRDYTEKVDDERILTMKRNVHKISTESESDKSIWEVKTNQFRTRVPPDFNNKDLNQNHIFLFLGDSVPFGGGVNAEDSIPYLFKESAPEFLVINGAVPGYSLKSIVNRYKYEFKHIKNIQYIYFQAYDPVNQYVSWGGQWSKEDSWAARPQKLYQLCALSKSPWYDFILRYSNFIQLLQKSYNRNLCKTFTPFNDRSDRALRDYIDTQLIEFKNNVPANVKVFLVNVAPGNFDRLDYKYAHALDITNDEFKKMALKLNFNFIDTRSILTHREDFIDSCCHLSKKGAQKLAETLKSYIH